MILGVCWGLSCVALLAVVLASRRRRALPPGHAVVMGGPWILRLSPTVESAGLVFGAGERVELVERVEGLKRGKGERCFRVRVLRTGDEGWAFVPFADSGSGDVGAGTDVNGCRWCRDCGMELPPWDARVCGDGGVDFDAVRGGCAVPRPRGGACQVCGTVGSLSLVLLADGEGLGRAVQRRWICVHCSECADDWWCGCGLYVGASVEVGASCRSLGACPSCGAAREVKS